MTTYSKVQRTYDNQVPEWYWCEAEREDHEDHDIICRIEDEMWDEWRDGKMKKSEYYKKISLLDDYRQEDITLKELNNMMCNHKWVEINDSGHHKCSDCKTVVPF